MTTRRKVPVSKIKTPRKKGEAPIYTWAFKSSQPRAGGKLIDYITQLNTDETLSCNCPGWIFAKKGQPRACAHTRQVEHEVPDILRAFNAGEVLPTLDEGKGQTGFTNAPAAGPRTDTNPDERRFGRVIEL